MIFAVCQVRDDISSALRFDPQIRYVNHRYVNGDEIESERLPGEFAANLVRAADEFDPDHDYLLMAGDHLQQLAFSAMLSIRYEAFRVLRWDRREQAYFPVRIQS